MAEEKELPMVHLARLFMAVYGHPLLFGSKTFSGNTFSLPNLFSFQATAPHNIPLAHGKVMCRRTLL